MKIGIVVSQAKLPKPHSEKYLILFYIFWKLAKFPFHHRITRLSTGTVPYFFTYRHKCITAVVPSSFVVHLSLSFSSWFFKRFFSFLKFTQEPGHDFLWKNSCNWFSTRSLQKNYGIWLLRMKRKWIPRFLALIDFSLL